MSATVNDNKVDGGAGTESRRLKIGPGTVAERLDVPTYVVTNEVLDRSSSTLISNQATEARALRTGATNPTDVSKFSAAGNRGLTPVIEIEAKKRSAQQRSQVLQQWEGTVEEVRSDSFGARLRNLTTDGAPDEWATLLLDELNENERGLVTPGAVFYWSIGYLIEPYGQRRTASTIYFRQLPAWSTKDHAQARLVAESFSDILTDDLSERSTSG